jgi:signal transduction histidine kinase
MKERVFTPNFTTKSSGTGLGLAICANIVETFNGRIHFATNPGEGTTFFVEIPLMRLEGNVREQEHVML